jgi:hypothetical protein
MKWLKSRMRPPGIRKRTSGRFNIVFLYNCGRTLQIARKTDWKIRLLEVWAFWELFVRDLYADLALMAILEFRAFLE